MSNAAKADDKEQCSGILHLDRNDRRFGGGKGEGEGICIISKPEERKKVLATCSPGHHCIVTGLIEDCKDSGECGELTYVLSVRKK